MPKPLNPPVGYQTIEGNCSLPEKIVNKKENEIWLIRAPKDFPETEVDKIKVDLKHGANVNQITVGNRKFNVTVGDKNALAQLFYCYKDEKKGIIPGRPFAHEIIITEVFTEDEKYATFDGEGHDIPEVKQLTDLKLRYLPPGAVMPEVKRVVKHEKKVEKKEKKETKVVVTKKEKSKKKKTSKK